MTGNKFGLLQFAGNERFRGDDGDSGGGILCHACVMRVLFTKLSLADGLANDAAVARQAEGTTMATFNLHISNSVEADVAIDVDNAHEAINAGFNALAKFACRSFPPPENVSIAISNAEQVPVATLKFSFEITYAPGVIS